MSSSTIKSLLNDLESKITKINAIAGKGDKLNLFDAMKLGSESSSIANILKKQTAAYRTFNPSEDENKTILVKLSSIVELTETQMGFLLSSQPRLESLKVGGLVKRSIVKNAELSTEQERVMLEKFPSSMAPEAEALAIRRRAAFDKVIAAFEHSVGGEDKLDRELDVE